MNTFMGIEIGKRAIVTHQVALDVTGHNIANANTDGYSRQAANIVTTRPWHMPVLVGNSKVGQLGTGSEVSDIQRYRDSFIDAQIRKEARSSGYWKSVQENLSQIEGVLNEPSNEGLRSVMDSFWKSWQDLSASPESESSRSVVKEKGAALVEAVNHSYQQLVDLRDDVNTSIQVDTTDINSIAEQIAALNRQVQAIRVAGKQPNDLMDKRDLLIDELSSLVDITVSNETNGVEETETGLEPKYNGMVTIQLGGGRTLVQGGNVSRLDIEKDRYGMNLVVWADTKAKADIGGGELRGLLDVRGKTASSKENAVSEYKEIIPEMIASLNTLAKTIIQKTNQVQRSGYSINNKTAFPDGTNFFSEDVPTNFDGNWAKFMKIDAAMNDVKNIAAASNRTWNNGVHVNVGDGSNALKIAQLKQNLNKPEYMVATDTDLSTVLNFPSSAISGFITVNYRDEQGVLQSPVSIYLEAPDKPYQDLQQLATAIRKKLAENETLSDNGIPVDLRCNGNKLEFFSTSSRFSGISDGNGNPAVPPYLLGGTGFTALFADTESKLVQNATSDDYWRSICANTGVQSQEAKRMVTNQDQLLSELENKKQSLSGVSLDEEMTNMIKFQHAYNAASRFITTMDEELSTIITSMGLVGR